MQVTAAASATPQHTPPHGDSGKLVLVIHGIFGYFRIPDSQTNPKKQTPALEVQFNIESIHFEVHLELFTMRGMGSPDSEK